MQQDIIILTTNQTTWAIPQDVSCRLLQCEVSTLPHYFEPWVLGYSHIEDQVVPVICLTAPSKPESKPEQASSDQAGFRRAHRDGTCIYDFLRYCQSTAAPPWNDTASPALPKKPLYLASLPMAPSPATDQCQRSISVAPAAFWPVLRQRHEGCDHCYSGAPFG